MGNRGRILGDAVSYWIGNAYGPALLKSGALRKRRRSVARARLLFYRYGFLAVFAGRFMGAFRSLIPGMAGIMKMPQGDFSWPMCFPGRSGSHGCCCPGILACVEPMRWAQQAAPPS